jgi:hypothetical protein
VRTDPNEASPVHLLPEGEWTDPQRRHKPATVGHHAARVIASPQAEVQGIEWGRARPAGPFGESGQDATPLHRR